MDVTSDCPCVQFYAANFVKNENGKNGHVYNKRDAFCLETQVEPNAVNVEDFHSPVLNAGEQYDSMKVIVFISKNKLHIDLVSLIYLCVGETRFFYGKFGGDFFSEFLYLS